MEPDTWVTSSYSGYNGDCVACKKVAAGVLVRDSKDPDGPVITFALAEWRAFLASLRP